MATANELAPNNPDGPHQGRLAHLPDDFLPRNLVGPIFEEAQESSLVLRMGRQIPVTYGETVIPVNTRRPEVGQVGIGTSNEDREGYEKPLSGVGWGQRSFSPIKLATIVTASEEFARMNVNGLYSQIRSDLAYAIGRGIDLAVFHGRQPINGGPLSGIDTANVLANTPNQIMISANPDTTLVDDLVTGYKLVADQHEFSSFAVDPRYRADLATAMVTRDEQGNIANPASLNLAADTATLLGFPMVFGRAVGGDLGAATDSGMRLLGGDFSQLRYGYADQVRVKVTDTATVTDANGQAVSMWQTNQVALLVEVTFGWVVGDLEAFVKYSESTTS